MPESLPSPKTGSLWHAPTSFRRSRSQRKASTGIRSEPKISDLRVRSEIFPLAESFEAVRLALERESEHRRHLAAEPIAVKPATGIAPLLAGLTDRQAATGLPPPYLPKDEQGDDT